MIQRLLWLLLTLSLVMTATSFTHYSSIGLDHETGQGENVIRHYWRLRWPSNGAFFIGYGTHPRPDLTEPSERFDPAAQLFAKRTATPQWTGSLLGIRTLHTGTAAIHEYWIGVPALYLPILFGLSSLWQKKRLLRS